MATYTVTIPDEALDGIRHPMSEEEVQRAITKMIIFYMKCLEAELRGGKILIYDAYGHPVQMSGFINGEESHG